MTILCWSPLDALTSRKPSAPAPPDLLIGTTDCFIRLCLATTPWEKRAIWSAPPPVPAGMMNSTDLVGSQAMATWLPPSAASSNALQVVMRRLNMSRLLLWLSHFRDSTARPDLLFFDSGRDNLPYVTVTILDRRQFSGRNAAPRALPVYFAVQHNQPPHRGNRPSPCFSAAPIPE